MGPSSQSQRGFGLGVLPRALVLCALVAGPVALDLLTSHLPPDGRSRGHLVQAVGRFHPLIVHLPIGLFLLVPVLECAGRMGRRADLRSAAGFVLLLATLAASVAALDGWLLAWGGGYSGPLVARHLTSARVFSTLCLCAYGMKLYADRPGGKSAFYVLLLAVCLAYLVKTSHEGGEITHGERYLTEDLPLRVQRWLGVPPPAPPRPRPTAAKAGTLYAERIAPIFQRSCVSCHNPNKVKGGLRMDSYEELMRGGDDGPVIDPWHPDDSDLLRRVQLPHDDDDFMPSNGKNVLSDADIALLERWIASGATATQPAR